MNLIALLLIALPAQAGDWRYVVSPGEVAVDSASFRLVPLTGSRPEDVTEPVAYRGQRRRYGQIRFGGPNSTRVTVVLDERGPGQADLYVDADRNRRIEERDLVPMVDRVARMPLSREFAEEGSLEHDRREVAFRLGATGRTLAFAHLGSVEGAVDLGSEIRRARRIDADGNGLFADSDDHIAIDLDGNGRFDAPAEVFLYAPVLGLAERRVAVRGDLRGERLTLAPLTSTGTIRLRLATARTRDRPLSAHVVLAARDGMSVRVDGVESAVEVPPGEYRVVQAVLTLQDPAGGQPWSFTFALGRDPRPPLWHTIAEGQSLELDPFRRFDWKPEVLELPGPGRDLRIAPILRTADGLIIIVAYRGAPAAPALEDRTSARVTFSDASGQAIERVTSGFS